MAAVKSAALESGSKIRTRISNEPQPSMVAASSSSLGTPRKNCISMKMKNGPPPKIVGTINGRYVSIHLKPLNMIYLGTSVTAAGSIMVEIMMENRGPLPLNWNRANP